MHLLGQSWGAMLALEYALHHRRRLKSLVLSSGAASVAECVAGMDAWRLELPEAERAALARHEATGEFGHPDYKAALELLYRRHLCRVRPLPEHLNASMNNMALPVYETMWGPNEFTCTGTLRGWDRTDRLGEIRVPTLIAVGRWDEVSPSCAETMHRGIPGSRLVVFEDSSHSIHFEEPERFMAELRAFLLDAEAAERA
jgi:proline iminopeptidase